MPTRRTLLSVSAGIGQPSSTRMLADRLRDATLDALRRAGVHVEERTVDLREHAHAIVDRMVTGNGGPELDALLGEVASADGLVLVTPLYTTSYSGLFKSFVDVLDKDALRGTPVLLGATGGTARHSLALEYALRPLFAYLHADVVPTSVFAATDDWAGTADTVRPLPVRIDRAAGELAEAVLARANPGPADPYADVPDLESMLRGL